MTPQPFDSLHPIHLRYVLADPHHENNNLHHFFEALGEIDPLDHRWMIGFATSAIGSESIPDLPTEEEESEKQLLHFRKRCFDILNSGVENFFLTNAIVTYTCNYLRTQGDPEWAKANSKWLLGAKKYFQQRAADGQVAIELAEECARMVDERTNNSVADAELARERYKLFCEKVVCRLLPPAWNKDV